MDTRRTADGNEAVEPEALPVGLDDGSMLRTVSEDPLAKLLSVWWRELGGVIAVLVVGYYFYYRFEDAYRERMEGAADNYSHVRENYDAVTSALNEVASSTDIQKKDLSLKNASDAVKKLTESLRVLSLTEPPYKDYASIYQGLLISSLQTLPAAELTKIPEASELTKLFPNALKAIDWSNLKIGSPERFTAELQALVVAKNLLDDQTKLGQGRAMLKDLAERGTVSAVTAAVSLASISITDDERADAKKVLENLKERKPEQLDLILPELKRL